MNNGIDALGGDQPSIDRGTGRPHPGLHVAGAGDGWKIQEVEIKVVFEVDGVKGQAVFTADSASSVKTMLSKIEKGMP